MTLGEANIDRDKLVQLANSWVDRSISIIFTHDLQCCHLARDWFLAMDKSQPRNTAVSSMPSWIKGRYKWGPNRWPLYWCEALQSDMLDCGALAALACEGLRGRGIPALQTQLIRFYGRLNGVQWSEIWRDDNIPSGWVEDAFVYHEVCAVLQDGERKIEIWDPTGNYWIDPSQVVGYSSPVAIRVVGQDYLDYHVEEPLQWGSYHLKPNEWLLLI